MICAACRPSSKLTGPVVTRLVLDLGTIFGLPTVDSQLAAQVTRYTVSEINWHLPLPGPKG